MTAIDPEPLSFDDVQILHLESDAIKGHTGKLLVLEPVAQTPRLEVARLRDRVAERLPSLGPLRRRVEVPARGDPVWVEAPEIDLEWHVTEHPVGSPLDDAGFRAAAGEILSRRLDHERPLWRLDLVPLEGGRSGLVGRLHHAMADGVTAIRLVAGLLWDEPDGKEPGKTADGSARPAASPRAAPAAEQRERSVLVRLPGALRRELRPGRDTIMDRHIGSEREVAWTVVSLARLKAIGHAAGEGVTVNDVVLAVVAGGLRSWLGSVGGRAEDLRAQVPVCMHLREAGTTVGNRDSFLNVDLPLSEPDPLARIRTINAETTEAKVDHDADTLYSFFHALGRFRPLHDGVTRVISGPREFALSVSNVPGPRERPAILGHELREFCSFAEPADRHALRVAVISLGGDLAFGLCSDPKALGGLDDLADALEESVLELEAAV